MQVQLENEILVVHSERTLLAIGGGCRRVIPPHHHVPPQPKMECFDIFLNWARIQADAMQDILLMNVALFHKLPWT